MKENIDCFLSKVSKVIKGENFLYLVPKKERRNLEFIQNELRLQWQKKRFFDFF